MVRRKHVVASLAVMAITYVGFIFSYFFTPDDIYILSSPTGRVIDQQTQAPVAGVSVLAIWDMQGGIGMVTPKIYPLHIAQAETNEDGYFRFKVPPLILYRTSAWNASLSGSQPIVFFLKSGYMPEAVSNRGVPKTENMLGKDLISVPVVLNDDGEGRVVLHRFTAINEQAGEYRDILLDSLKSLLLPVVLSCEVSKIAAFYTTFVNMTKTAGAPNSEPKPMVSGIKTCGGRDYEYF